MYNFTKHGKDYAGYTLAALQELTSQGVISQAEMEAITKPSVEDLTVTISTGKTFKANDKSLGRMRSSLDASGRLGLTQTLWVLADGNKSIVSINELLEAHDSTIQAIGQVVLADPL